MGNPWALTDYQKEIDLYLMCAVHFYGHITPKQFLLLFNRFHKEHKLYKEDLVRWMNKLNYQAKTYRVYTNAIINRTVKTSVIDEIIDCQQGKPFNIPEAAEAFVKWASPDYYPTTTHSEELSRFLISEGKLNPVLLPSLMSQLFHSVLMDERTQSQMDILEQYHITEHLSFSKFQKLIALHVDYVNNTPHWANCGFSPCEMISILQTREQKQ